MILHEFLFLGLLKEGPKHGYDIKKEIRDIIFNLSGLRPKSIYYPLNKMEKDGLVVKRKAKSGRRPAKYVYELTEKGAEKFEFLLGRSLVDVERPILNIDLSLYFLPYIDKELARKKLQVRLKILNRFRHGISEAYNSAKQKGDERLLRILSHDLDLVDAESASMQKIVDGF